MEVTPSSTTQELREWELTAFQIQHPTSSPNHCKKEKTGKPDYSLPGLPFPWTLVCPLHLLLWQLLKIYWGGAFSKLSLCLVPELENDWSLYLPHLSKLHEEDWNGSEVQSSPVFPTLELIQI